MILGHAPSRITARLLAALGLGTTPPAAGPWPIYVDKEPATPDNVLTVFTTQGTMVGRVFTGEQDTQYGIQVRIRAADPQVGWVQAEAIYNALCLAYDIPLVVLNTDNTTSRYLIHGFTKIGDVLPLGNEPSSQRVLFTVNAQLVVDPQQ